MLTQRRMVHYFRDFHNFRPSPRASTSWGGTGIVRAALALLRRAINNPDNTHFFLMSGQRNLIKSDDYIRDHLSRSSGNYFDVVSMPYRNKPISRLERWHLYDSVLPKRLFPILPKRNVAKVLRGVQPFCGSTWWMLSRHAVQELLNFLHDNPWYLKAFRYSELADEMFFQTALLRLGIAPRLWGAYRNEVDRGKCSSGILQEFNHGWHFAARKFA